MLLLLLVIHSLRLVLVGYFDSFCLEGTLGLSDSLLLHVTIIYIGPFIYLDTILRNASLGSIGTGRSL